MDYRHLCDTGVRVSTVSLGTTGLAGTGRASPVDETVSAKRPGRDSSAGERYFG